MRGNLLVIHAIGAAMTRSISWQDNSVGRRPCALRAPEVNAPVNHHLNNSIIPQLINAQANIFQYLCLYTFSHLRNPEDINQQLKNVASKC